jgi:hypothetical protein
MQHCIPAHIQKSTEKQDLIYTQKSLSSYHNSHYPILKRLIKWFSRSVLLLHVYRIDSSLAFRGLVLRVLSNWRDRLKNKNLK